MCELWKWIAISTLIPLVLVSFWMDGLSGWLLGPWTRRGIDRIIRRTLSLAPYRWWYAFGIFVFAFSAIIYAVHCQ